MNQSPEKGWIQEHGGANHLSYADTVRAEFKQKLREEIEGTMIQSSKARNRTGPGSMADTIKYEAEINILSEVIEKLNV